jgi:hypothetical protein
VRDTLGVWPALPLLIRAFHLDLEEGLGEVVAAIKRSDRVREISLENVSSSDLETLSIAMQEPLSELTELQLKSDGEVALPDSFLGGSAPRLRILSLDSIPFPGLPNLLLSATHLVKLRLEDIPHSGYILPEAMVTVLSTLTSLEDLWLGFQSFLFRPDRAIRRPPTRRVLSVLTHFSFKGDSEYLDELVAHIDAPQLNKLDVSLFNDIVFDTPQFVQFICRTPRLAAPKGAHFLFGGDVAVFGFISTNYELHLKISCLLNWQVSSLLPPVATLEDLYIAYQQSHRKDIENALWLEILQLHPFRTVKNFYLDEECALRIVPALQELVGGRATEMLPSLQNIFLEGFEPSGPIKKGIGKFVATRQITSHPIVVSRWY